MAREGQWQSKQRRILCLNELERDFVDEQTAYGSQKVFGTKHVDKTNEKAVSAVARDVVGGIGKDAEKVAEFANELFLAECALPAVLDKCRYDALDSLWQCKRGAHELTHRGDIQD